jgi:hypothetical protein
MEPSHERPESDKDSIADKKSLDKQDKDVDVELKPVGSCVVGQTTGTVAMRPDALGVDWSANGAKYRVYRGRLQEADEEN